MAISSIGVGSGLDINNILTNLEKEQVSAKLNPITKEKTSVQTKIKAYDDTLKSVLNSFNRANEALQKENFFQSKKSIGNDKYFSATVNDNATIGEYTIKVDNLAKAQTLVSVKSFDKSTKVDEATTVTININGGASYEVKVDAGSSLEDVAKAINQTKDSTGKLLPVTATLVKNKDKYQFVISSKETGTENRITSISVNGSEKIAEILEYTFKSQEELEKTGEQASSGMIQKTEAENANYSINGINLESSSNVIKDALDGVDLTLKNVTNSEDGEATLNITEDQDRVVNAIKEWVKAFNQLKSTQSDLTKFTPTTDRSTSQNSTNGPLVGDSIVRNLDQSIRSVFSYGEISGDHSFRVLSEIGIQTDPTTGTLTVKDDELKKAISEKGEDVAYLFVGDKVKNADETTDESSKTNEVVTGFANKISKILDQYLKSDGVISSKVKGLNETIKSLDKRYDRADESITSMLQKYRANFSRLDVLISNMNSQMSSLTAQLNSLSNSNKK